jgi:xyloglucan-specific endo-beta-1,4-glucanase
VKTEQVQISKIKSIDSTWNWNYAGTGLVTNVAYDVFTSSTPGGSETYELMIWLGNFNAGPIARFVHHTASLTCHANTDLVLSQWGADGKPVPILKAITLAGTTWDLYKGPNGQMTVFSFLPSNGKNITSFKGDINSFLKYLTQNQGVAATQYLKSVGAGTEPTLGAKAVFTTSKYTVDVKYS